MIPHDALFPWQVRIRRHDSAIPAGGGVLISGSHIVTCAHTVNPQTAGVRPTDAFLVDFHQDLGYPDG